MRNLLTVTCAALAVVGCARDASNQDEPVDLTRPAYTTAELPDDVSARLPGRIVVDFVDGITKAEIDELEKDWGIDLEFNSQEGPIDGVTTGAFEGDLDALLAKI
jgi:serine protease